MPHPSNSYWLITQIIYGEEYRSLSSSLCSVLVASSVLRPNILLSTSFSKTPSLHSFLNVSDQVSHPYQTTGKIIFLYILIFIFLNSKLEDKRIGTKWYQAFPDFNLLLISSWIEFDLLRLFPIFELFHPFKRTIMNLYFVTLSCILISRYGHVLSFISIDY